VECCLSFWVIPLPLPPWGYFARKSIDCYRLRGFGVYKMQILNGLLAKYRLHVGYMCSLSFSFRLRFAACLIVSGWRGSIGHAKSGCWSGFCGGLGLTGLPVCRVWLVRQSTVRKNMQKQRQMRGSFAALRMTTISQDDDEFLRMTTSFSGWRPVSQEGDRFLRTTASFLGGRPVSQDDGELSGKKREHR
jgi:hypothetical protein